MASGANRQKAGVGRVRTSVARIALALSMATAIGAMTAALSGPPSAHAQPAIAAADPDARMLVEADELVYDNVAQTVSAVGNVEINYDGRTLQADRVVYDQRSGRVRAEGNARLLDPDGAVVTGSVIELTDDFRTGFIDSLRVEQEVLTGSRPATGRFTAPRAERIEGDITVFQRGTYTTCEPCAENPLRPPLWQVKAARIIHDREEQTIYYENASLEFLGVPIANVPYFWSPDPTVRRKTGFLAPTFVFSEKLGFGTQIPFFWNLAPNYDLTFRPAYLSRQGFLGDVEWRHRLMTGSYSIRAAGIFEQDSSAFNRPQRAGAAGGARGMIRTAGRFSINPRWSFGWNATFLSDRHFLEDYGYGGAGLSEAISTVFLQGRGERSFFEARGYYFKVLTSNEVQKSQPIVHPVIDYDRRFTGPDFLGGEIGLRANVTSLSRERAQFLDLPDGRRAALGLAGNYARASAELSWRRRFIDGLGQAWTPFAYARLDGFWFSPNLTGFQNADARAFVSGRDDTAARVMPAVGLDYRFPLAASGLGGTHVIEPMVQIVARPNETLVGRFPNEDAQSVAFDTSSLFAWDKFAGFDRAEGGVRANYALQYTFNGDNGVFVHAIVGQSAHLAGRNSYRETGLVDAGAGSGLDKRLSDYVGGITVQPWRGLQVGARARLDRDTLDFTRIEANATARIGAARATLAYAHFARQPQLGFDRAREGLSATGRIDLTENWFLDGSIALDLARFRDGAPTGTGNPRISSLSVGAGYADECTTFTVSMTAAPIRGATGKDRYNRTVMFRLELVSLGEIGLQQSLDSDVASR